MVSTEEQSDRNGRQNKLIDIANAIFDEIWWNYHEEWWHPSYTVIQLHCCGCAMEFQAMIYKNK